MKEKDLGKDRENQLEQERVKLDAVETMKLPYDPDSIQEAITQFVDDGPDRKLRLQ